MVLWATTTPTCCAASSRGYKARWEQSARKKSRTRRRGVRLRGSREPRRKREAEQDVGCCRKIDAIAKDKATGKHIIVEHKTNLPRTSGPGSDYWKKLPIDGQVSGYYVGASTLGYEVDVCLYDVIRKPTD